MTTTDPRSQRPARHTDDANNTPTVTRSSSTTARVAALITILAGVVLAVSGPPRGSRFRAIPRVHQGQDVRRARPRGPGP